MADERDRTEEIGGRYASPLAGLARTAAQQALLKPYVLSQVTCSVHGKENLKGLKAPFIVVGNHSSHLDATLIFCTMPTRLSKNLATGAAADTFFNSPLQSTSMALFFNAYPIERKGKKNSTGRHRGMTGKLLSSGVPILIFPEGTRSRTGAMGQWNPGPAALSISRNAPIVPVAIVGAYAAWPSSAKRVKPGRPPVHLVYGSPMKAAPGEIASELTERVRAVVRSMHDATARAYEMPTLDDYDRAAALRALTAGPSTPGTETTGTKE